MIISEVYFKVRREETKKNSKLRLYKSARLRENLADWAAMVYSASSMFCALSVVRRTLCVGCFTVCQLPRDYGDTWDIEDCLLHFCFLGFAFCQLRQLPTGYGHHHIITLS